jgi:peroxiredoxin
MSALVMQGSSAATTWSDAEKPIVKQINTLRSLPDAERSTTTRTLALQIRQLAPSAHRVALANGLASLSTEGDFGRDTLQAVTTTLATALREHPVPTREGAATPAPYVELARLVRYEHMQASLDDTRLRAALAELDAADQRRGHADFSLKEVRGSTWTLSALRGHVVLVNFWATWCPPCRKEIPDLAALQTRFKDQGLVVLGISDETAAKVVPFVASHAMPYPVLLDPGRKVNTLFEVEGIPQSFVFDRQGRLVAEAIDMRTQAQFLEMLGRAGLK